VRSAGALTGAALAILVAGLVFWAPHWWGGGPDEAAGSSVVPVSWQRPAVSGGDLVARTGVKITQVAVTGGGGLVDLRYQVVDPDKAAAIHDKRKPPALVDEKSGVVVNQLFMDHSHSGAFTAGVTYYLVFNNPANWVGHGSRVTVLLGDAQVEHVVVR
jgi:hypothetical protein